MANTIYFKSQSEFRKWLEKNHSNVPELIVGFYKKSSEKEGITYPQALDEALSFGWIDGVRKRVDEERYTIRFTPRRANSIWSAVNIKRFDELSKMGVIQASGKKAFESDKKRTQVYSYEKKQAKLDPAYEKKFKSVKGAWEFFSSHAPWYQRSLIFWVMSAKKEETRLKRLAALIDDSKKKIKRGPLESPYAK